MGDSAMKTEVVMKRDKIYELGKQYHDLITEYGDGDDFGAWGIRLKGSPSLRIGQYGGPIGLRSKIHVLPPYLYS